MPQRFVKYHGIGNDFLIMDQRAGALGLDGDRVRALCDRHRGVGADGVLLLVTEPGSDVRMRVHNADGSESELCGNGLRCVAHYLYDTGSVPPTRRELRIASGRSVYPVERLSETRFRVSMGVPSVGTPTLPPASAARRPLPFAVQGRTLLGTALSFGNPHLVLFADESPLELAERYGADLERHPDFPERVNVTFARRESRGFGAVVFERGVGITEACGSGACAVAVAAVWSGAWSEASPMEVRLPGGVLVVCVETSGQVTLEGEAVRVFAGEVPAL